MLTIIAAITASRGAIGRKGELIYHISEDLKRFKALTTGHTVIMGRHTFESLPKGALPNRRNIVITSNPDWSAPSTETAHSVTEAIEMASADPEAFIIGGGRVYADTLPVALIEGAEPADADTFFPPIDPTQWEITDMSEPQTDPRTSVPYRFITFSRKQ